MPFTWIVSGVELITILTSSSISKYSGRVPATAYHDSSDPECPRRPARTVLDFLFCKDTVATWLYKWEGRVQY